MARSGIRMTDIFHHERLESRVRTLASAFVKRYGSLLEYDVEDEITRLKACTEKLRPYVTDQTPLLRKAEKAGWPILVEGANALMLDIDAGTYPYVTSR